MAPLSEGARRPQQPPPVVRADADAVGCKLASIEAGTVKTSTGTDGPAHDDEYELLDYEE